MSSSDSSVEERGAFRQVVGNAGTLLGGRAVNAVLGLAYTAIAARALGVETFGVLVLIHAYVVTVGDVAKFQSWQAILTYGTAPFSQGRFDEFQRVLRFSLVLDMASGVVGIVIAVLGVWLIGTGLGWPQSAQPAVALYAAAIVFMVSATPTGVLRLLDRFDLLAAQSAIASVVRLVGAAIAWNYGAGLSAFLLIWFLGQVAAFAFLFGTASIALRRSGALAGFHLRTHAPLGSGLPGIWSFVWSTNFNATLALAFTQVGTLMVGALLGAREAGLYRIAKQVADAVAKPAKLIVPALYPELARLAMSEDRKPLRKLVVQLALAAGAVATSLLLIAAFLGGPALRLIIGPEFVEAREVMLWLLAAAVIGIWSAPLEPLLISTGLAGAAFRARALVTLPYIPLLYLMTRSAGLHGAGTAAVIGALMLFASQFWLVWRWFRRPSAAGSAGSDAPPSTSL